jgi:GAF domain-containing protein
MSQNRLRVLLVDDEFSLREPLTKYLETIFEFEVDPAATYQEAIDLVKSRQGQYDVALIDRLLIPPPDGIQLMRDIKSNYPEIECIIATGWGTEERQIALQEGAFRYIEKPFNYEELEALIRTAAQQVRLRAINRDVLSKHNLDDVLQQITAAARSLALADDAEIQLLDETTGNLKSYGMSEEALPFSPLKSDPVQQLTRQIIGSGKTEAYPDLPKKADFQELVKLGFQSLVCVPIPGAEGNIGTLCAYSRRPGQFDRGSDVVLLQTLASQAGLAIANARAFEETRTHANYMEALVRTTGQLTQTTDFNEQLQLTWDFVRENLNTPVFYVALYDKPQGVIEFPMIFDEGKRLKLDPKDFEQASRTTIAGYVIKTAVEFYCPTSEARNKKCRELQIKSTSVGDPCQSCLCLPLEAGGEVLGALSVQSYQPYAFSPALLDACRALANHLAIAIENSRLVSTTQRTAEELDTLLGLSIDLASSIEPRQVMDRVCQAAVEYFQAQHSGLVLFDELFDYGRVEAEHPSDFGSVGIRIPLRGVPEEERLLNYREPLQIPDVAACNTLGPVKDILLELGILSTLIVPVVIKDKLLGSFSIDAVGNKRQFTSEEVELAKSFAAQAAVAIDHARLFDETQSRAKLLETLDESARHIRAEKDPERLMHEIVRLAAELVGCQSGCLLKYERHRGELEVTVVHQIPQELQHQRVMHDEGSIGLAARTGERKSFSDYSNSPYKDPVFERLGFNFGVATPLRAAGDVTAVLFLADPKPEYRLVPAAEEALDRFVNQAAIALNTSQLLTTEQRAMDQQEILLKVSDYIQAADDLDKILHVVLTGVTAGYGLGLNRAALLLLAESEEQLVGHLGIGHYEEGLVRRDWLEDQRSGRNDFSRYIDRLEKGEIGETPISSAIRDLILPMTVGDILTQVVAKRRYKLVYTRDKKKLAQEFVDAFQPAFPLIIVPLVARERTIGLLVADNKFTNDPITPELIKSLLTYANSAAIAIENRRLYVESQNKLSQVERTRRAAGMVAEAVVRRELSQVLKEIAERTCSIMSADSATLYAYNETTKRFTDWGYSNPGQRDPNSMVPPDRLKSISSPYKLLDLKQEPFHRVAAANALGDELLGGLFMKSEGMQTGVGMQLRAGDQIVGVMFVNFRDLHKFSEEEISTIQLFADQAAAAIHNKQLYDEVKSRANALEALYESGRIISGSHTLQRTLDQIAVQALTLVGDKAGDGCASQIVLKHGSRLQFAAASSPDLLARLKVAVMAQLKTETPIVSLLPGNKVGVVGRVAISGVPKMLGDVSKDPDYIPLDPQTRSELAVPMKTGDQVIGVINLEAPHKDIFVEDDLRSLELLAAQAAITVQTARLNEQTQLVAEIGREANSIELKPFLGSLFGRLTRLFSERDIPVYLNLGVYNIEKQAIELIPTPYYPAEIRARVQSIEGKGIMVWAAKHRQAVYVPDVTKDARYNRFLDNTQSEYAIPVFFGDKLLAVLDLESPIPDAFSKEDQGFLKTIANQIASTLKNVQQYNELKRTQGLVGSRTALAWVGMISNVYRHEMSSSAAVIRERLNLLRTDLTVDQLAGITEHLESIEKVAQKILAIPLAPPLSSAEGIQHFSLCELLRQRLAQLRAREYFTGIEFEINCSNAGTSMVRASPEWIKRLVDLLCYNAAEAMVESSVKRLTVKTAVDDEILRAIFQDVGKGISAEIREHLFERPVSKREGEKGLGIGLMMARLIVETYGGGIDVESTSSSGTSIYFWLPLETRSS